MLPVIEYENYTIVIPKVVAVGQVSNNDDKHSFDVYLMGNNQPFLIEFLSVEEAEESRRELVGLIAQYYYTQEYGPDFQLEDLFDDMESDDSAQKPLSAEDADINEKH